MTLAPIILFVYNRPNHTKQSIEALLQNSLSKESNLFIYSDAPKNQDAISSVQEVRDYIHTITGFKTITIIERERNFGLADSIIGGVTDVINQYGKAIVLEDDIVTSPAFLEYMNIALNKYEQEEKVWSISAWNYPLDPNPIQEDTFFWRIPHCWGWATWKDRWIHYKRDIQWVENNFNKSDICHINLEGTADYWKHYLSNKKQKIKTWAIFWYLIAYKHNKLTLMPKEPLIWQIGFDNSGVDCSADTTLANKTFILNAPTSFPDIIQENRIALEAIRSFHLQHKKTLLQRIFNKIFSILGVK